METACQISQYIPSNQLSGERVAVQQQDTSTSNSRLEQLQFAQDHT